VFTDITAVFFNDILNNEKVMSISNLWIWAFPWKFFGPFCAWNSSRRRTWNISFFFYSNAHNCFMFKTIVTKLGSF